MALTISLLHATHHRHGGPLPVRDAWIAAADSPGALEHVFAMDGDDDRAVADTQGLLRAVGTVSPGTVTAVRNWNAAAALATGDLLMVVADDLFPTPGWDSALRNVVAPLDPTTIPYAVKVADGALGDSDVGDVEGDRQVATAAEPVDQRDRRMLLRHPVVTRAFYCEHGLFDDGFRGVYCDDDITRTAFWRAAILDGREVQIEHRHPVHDDSKTFTLSQSRINTAQEYAFGQRIYRRKWNRLQRGIGPRAVAADSISDRSELESAARTARRVATLAYLRHTAQRRTQRAVLGTAAAAARRIQRMRR